MGRLFSRQTSLNTLAHLTVTLEVSILRDRSEITREGGHYLCREGHNFFKQNFERVTIFFT